MTALKFLLGDENVEVVITGMMSVSEVVENIAVASGTYALTNTELRLFEKDRVELVDLSTEALALDYKPSSRS